MLFSPRSHDRQSSSLSARRGARGSRRQRLAFRPALAALEDRRLLSTLTVTSGLDNVGGPGDGTLRGEIAAAQSGDTIVFAPSLDGQRITLSYLNTISQLEINKNLTIQGPGAGLLTVDGGNQTRVFQVDAGASVTISGLTIGDGNGKVYSYGYGGNAEQNDGEGGGILNLGTLALSGCTVTSNNSSWRGGGIYNAGTMTLGSCTVSGNSAYSWGGGIYNAGTTTLSRCTVSYNSAALGGGIVNDTPGTLTILSSIVKSNTATAQDGADIYSLGSLTISKDSKVGKVSHK
jgi:hypothetical protein